MSIFHDPASLMQQARKQLQEKAPPTAKAERMVKDIKAGYSKDGLTDKEKAIAYATAWKAYNKTQKESHVVGKPAEKLGAVTSISKDEQEAAKQRTLAKAAALRKKREDQKEEFEIEEGMSLKDFKANRRNIKRREVSADAEKRGHVSKNIVTHGRKYSPDEAKSGRANMSDYERSVRKSVAMNPDQVGDTEESSDKTKNPKKLRKQKAMGELGEQSYQIDTAAHKSAQKIEKIRNLASGTNNANEKNAAMRKLSGPSLPLANSFEPEIINHLIENGFAETQEAAEAIMVNMSEEWRESIVEATVLAPKGGVAGSVQVNQTKTPGFLGTGLGSKTVSTPIPGTWTRNTPGRQASGPRSFDAAGSGSSGARAEMGDRSGPTDTERSRFNDALTSKHTKGDKSVAPSPKAVNQRASAQGHSGLMPTRGGNRDRTDTTTTRYEKPNQSWRGY